MKLFSRKQPREKSTLIILIENGAVHAGITLNTAGGAPRLVYETERVYATATQDTALLLTRMKKALASACDDISQEALPHIVRAETSRGVFDAIRFIYGAPWYFSDGRRVVLHEDTRITYSAADFKRIIDEQSAALVGEGEAEHMAIIERATTGWTIDGYRVASPEGKAGSKVAFNLFVGSISKKLQADVEESVMRTFQTHTFTHHSFAHVATRTLAARAGDESPFLTIHITESLTEMALFSHDAMIDTATFPGKVGSDAWHTSCASLLTDMFTHHHIPKRVIIVAPTEAREAAGEHIRALYTEIFRQTPATELLSAASFGSLTSGEKRHGKQTSAALCIAAFHESLNT